MMRKWIKITAAVIVGVIALVVALLWAPERSLESLRPEYAPPPSEFVDIQGMPLHFRDEGPASDSLPLVFIHGTGASLHTWNGWVQELKGKRRCLRFDLPAFGLTGPHPERNYSLSSYESVLHDFLDSMSVEEGILVGNSLGGLIAWKYALQKPNRVAGLILVDAAGVPQASVSRPLGFRIAGIPVLRRLVLRLTPRFLVEQSVENVFGNPERVTPDLVDRYYDLTLRAGNRRAFLDRAEYSWRDSTYLTLADWRKPTLILWGEKDQLTPASMAMEFSRVLPADTLVIFPELGHVPMEEAPETTASVLKEWLQRMP